MSLQLLANSLHKKAWEKYKFCGENEIQSTFVRIMYAYSYGRENEGDSDRYITSVLSCLTLNG